MNGAVVYAPKTLDTSDLTLFIDRKSGTNLSRTAYDFKTYFDAKVRSTDIDLGPTSLVDPHFSRNGERVIFKHLLSGEDYQLYSLNLKTNEFSRVSEDFLSYYYISLSPNGDKVAFVVGGNPLR